MSARYILRKLSGAIVTVIAIVLLNFVLFRMMPGSPERLLLGRIPGVQSVGVSSGPDGEFVFAVNHADDVSLKDVVPTVPGFQARVTQDGDGVVNVTAHDPESDG